MKTPHYWSLLALGFLLLFQAEKIRSARILGMFPLSATSHNKVFTALTKELAIRGHHLTVITPHVMKGAPANYTQIDVSKAADPHFSTFSQVTVLKPWVALGKLLNVTASICEDVLAMPEMKKLMNPKESGLKFDLMLITHFFSDCFYPYAHVYDVPVVVISPAGAMPYTDSMAGNIALPSFVPNVFFSFTDRMSFLERTLNSFSVVAMNAFMKFFMFPRHEQIARAHFGDIPPISEIHRRSSLFLLNNHFTYNYPRPVTPNIVDVGGIQLTSPKPLPKDLQKFMDEAKEGVVYFSMGSNLKSVNFPIEVRNALLSTFSELRQRVIMKWEGDGPLPGQSPNVRLEKWLPQLDLLAHPNMKLFITHGGLLSFQEAVMGGVPLLGIPFYGDQELNMHKVKNLGLGLKVPYKELTKEKLLEAIREILGDTSYHNKMKQLSIKALDQPEHPLQRAAFWTEYIIRHKGAKHLTPGSVDLAWCQLYLVDVVAVCVSIPVILFAALCYFVTKCCCRGKAATKKAPGKTKTKAKTQ